MRETHYFSSGERTVPKKLLEHCIVCGAKKNLVYYSTTDDFILQICNKCLNDLEEKNIYPQGALRKVWEDEEENVWDKL